MSASESEQMLIKPSNGLKEGLLLGIFLNLLAHIASDRETVHDAAIQVDLVSLLSLGEDHLRLVTLLGGEDLVGFRGCDGKRTRDCREFGFFDKAAERG